MRLQCRRCHHLIISQKIKEGALKRLVLTVAFVSCWLMASCSASHDSAAPCTARAIATYEGRANQLASLAKHGSASASRLVDAFWSAPLDCRNNSALTDAQHVQYTDVLLTANYASALINFRAKKYDVARHYVDKAIFVAHLILLGNPTPAQMALRAKAQRALLSLQTLNANLQALRYGPKPVDEPNALIAELP